MTSSLGNATTLVVKPGPAQPLLDALPAGALIVNQDANNSVWVSDLPGVIPGVGFEIGVGGSLVWQKDGRPAYACVDTGVNTPVTLSVGSAVGDLQNPVAVGLAVARQLLLTGVPNVLVTDTIVDNLVINNGQFSPAYDVSNYASLIVELPNNTIIDNAVLIVSFQTIDGVNGEQYLITCPADPFFVGLSLPFSTIIPVRGIGSVKLFWRDSGGLASPSIRLVGSNRTINGMASGYGVHGGIENYTTGTIAMANNNAYPLGIPGYSGLCQMDFSLTGGGAGEFYVQTSDITGTLQSIRIADTTEMHAAGPASRCYKQIILPQAVYAIGFISRTTVAAANATVNIVRNEPT